MADTIFALSSGAAPAAIGVIRISGARAGDALRSLVAPCPVVGLGGAAGGAEVGAPFDLVTAFGTSVHRRVTRSGFDVHAGHDRGIDQRASGGGTITEGYGGGKVSSVRPPGAAEPRSERRHGGNSLPFAP